MNFSEFETKLKDTLQEMVGSEVSVQPTTQIKNNNTVYHSLIFMNQHDTLSPVIHLNNCYQDLQDGKSFNQIATDIYSLYQKVKNVPPLNVDVLFSLEQIKDKIVYRLVNHKRNETQLKSVPHIRFVDLAIVFYIQLETDAHTSASLQITNKHLDLWKKTTEDIYAYAKENTCRIFPASMESILSAMKKLNPDEECWESVDEESFHDSGFQVLTNTKQHYGASCILYDHMLEAIGQKLQDNYYIIPSSTHEVLILSESIANNCDSLSEIIQNVNRTKVENEEILADHPYYYDRQTMLLRTA